MKALHLEVKKLEELKQKNIKNWKALLPQIRIYPVAAEHFTMLDKQFCDSYIARINEIVLPHNS
jgi:thioesterase domain-containing protein